jgi:histidinol-phosphate/aromatic aminotransferase/cobyric acid decarboxylase-like protein
VNALASRAGEWLLRDPAIYEQWCTRVQRWSAREGAWLTGRLAQLPGLEPLPSAANFLLVRGTASEGRPLTSLLPVLARRHRILLRDCRSFRGLDGHWLRIGLQNRAGNQRLLAAIEQALSDPSPAR